MCLTVKIPHKRTFIRRRFYKVLLEYPNPLGGKSYYTPFRDCPVELNKKYTVPLEYVSVQYTTCSGRLNIGEGVFHLCTTKKHAKEIALNLGRCNTIIVRAVVPKNTVIFKDCCCKQVGVTEVIYTKIV
jgi:hypothetical protein